MKKALSKFTTAPGIAAGAIIVLILLFFLVSILLLILTFVLPADAIEREIRETFWSIPFFLCMCIFLGIAMCCMFASAFQRGITAGHRLKNVLLSLLIAGILALSLWFSVINPIRDLPYLKSPAVLLLDAGRFDWEPDSESNSGGSHYLVGYDAQGERHRFFITEEVYSQGHRDWEIAYQDYHGNFNMQAQVRCLPHTNILLEWEYWVEDPAGNSP